MASTSEIRTWYIYKITNPNGCVYIGKTHNYMKRFFSYKGLHCKSQPVLYQSLKKYGFENHKAEKIEQFDSDSDSASNKEMFWIRTFMSNRNKWPEVKGLNLTDGGDGSIGAKHGVEYSKRISELKKGNKNRLGKFHTDETKNKISKTKKLKGDGRGKKWTAEARRKYTESRTGIPMSEDAKRHLSEVNKGRKYPNRKRYSKEFCLKRMEKFRKTVYKYSLTEVLLGKYKSVGEAAKEIGGTKSGIANCARGVIQTYKGFKYKYN